MADWPDIGSPAPDFSLKDQDGNAVSLADFRGRIVVVYFYPKDDTPGCTKEACAFRDAHAELREAGAAVLGISPDDAASHAAFAAKFGLNFPLLVDSDHAVAEAFGAWRERNRYGRKFMGIQRSTFIIDGEGNIAKMWKAVRVDGHDRKVLEAVDALSS